MRWERSEDFMARVGLEVGIDFGTADVGIKSMFAVEGGVLI